MKEKKIGKRTVEVHKMEGLYPYVRLEDFMKVCKGLEEENKNLNEEVKQLEERYDRNAELYKRLLEKYKKLKAENEYLHQLLPEADGYIIEKQMEQRLWNDGEEDTYEY